MTLGLWLGCANVSCGSAGGSVESWVRTFGTPENDESWDIIPARDGGYVVVGTGNNPLSPSDTGDQHLVRLDTNGDVLWASALLDQDALESGRAVVELENGRVMTFGTSSLTEGSGTRVALWSESGDLVETVRYLDSNLLAARAVGDGAGAIAVATGEEQEVGNLVSMRVDADVQLDWARTYGSGQEVVIAAAIATFSNGDLAMCSVLGTGETYLSRVDSSGEQRWTVATGGENQACTALAVNAADQVFAGGYRIDGPSGGTDLTVTAFASDGNWLWSRAWGTPNNEEITDLAVDGEALVAAGWIDPLGNRDGLLAGIALSGELQWAMTVGGVNDDQLNAVAIDGDGSIVAAGFSDTDARRREHLWLRARVDGGVAGSCNAITPLELEETIDENTEFFDSAPARVDGTLTEDRTAFVAQPFGSAQDECRGQVDGDGDPGTLYSCSVGNAGSITAPVLAAFVLCLLRRRRSRSVEARPRGAGSRRIGAASGPEAPARHDSGFETPWRPQRGSTQSGPRRRSR